jgi:hypothetical protein
MKTALQIGDLIQNKQTGVLGMVIDTRLVSLQKNGNHLDKDKNFAFKVLLGNDILRIPHLIINQHWKFIC